MSEETDEKHSGEQHDDKSEASQDAILNSITTEAGGFYKTILTLASGFMGGSLFFIKDIAPNPSCGSSIILIIGWVFLLFSIGFILCVRRLNLWSAKLFLEEEFTKAQNTDNLSSLFSTISVVLLFLGMVCIMIFGMLNL